jgi:carboxyl-terminal processing protease
MTISDGNGPGAIDPAAVAPLFVKTVSADSPAARAGVKPGDVITSVNGVPPFAGGTAVKAVSDWITNPSIGVPVRIRLRRPSTGSTFSVTLTPSTTNAGPPPNNDRLLRGDIAYVQVPGFFPGATKQVLAAISDMRARARLRGLILDLRGNGGGDPAERAALLGMLAHGKITSYECDAHANCAPNYTDDSVPLVHLPVIVLTDRDCASACDSFATGVKDLHLGVIVGTRTAGIAAGVQVGYELDNGTGIQMPDKYEVGANHEMVNGIGVAPDYYAPLTAAALSGGGDPGLDKALAILSMP